MADIIRTTLGPKSMLKMLLDPMGGIGECLELVVRREMTVCAVMTNDGHAILREIDVKHPAAKSMIELSRAQDEEVDRLKAVSVFTQRPLARLEMGQLPSSSLQERCFMLPSLSSRGRFIPASSHRQEALEPVQPRKSNRNSLSLTSWPSMPHWLTQRRCRFRSI